MIGGFFILKGHTPVHTDDVLEWGKWYQNTNRHVRENNIGEVRISTVFLGLDYNFSSPFGKGEPILFETMIFGGKHDGYQDRCSTWDEAIKTHQKALEMVK